MPPNTADTTATSRDMVVTSLVVRMRWRWRRSSKPQPMSVEAMRSRSTENLPRLRSRKSAASGSTGSSVTEPSSATLAWESSNWGKLSSGSPSASATSTLCRPWYDANSSTSRSTQRLSRVFGVHTTTR